MDKQEKRERGRDIASTPQSIRHTEQILGARNPWLIIIATSILILLVIGFGFGYLYASRTKGLDSPIVYGIEKLNEHNNAYFQCECRAPTLSTYFRINEDGWQSIDPNSHSGP